MERKPLTKANNDTLIFSEKMAFCYKDKSIYEWK